MSSEIDRLRELGDRLLMAQAEENAAVRRLADFTASGAIDPEHLDMLTKAASSASRKAAELYGQWRIESQNLDGS